MITKYIVCHEDQAKTCLLDNYSQDILFCLYDRERGMNIEMTTSAWMKSPNVLILPRFGSEGLRLEQQRTGSTVLLDSKQAKLK